MSASRPPYSLFRVVAEGVERITPHMTRITIDASRLPDLRPGLPARWLKVFVPAADGQSPAGRAYTVRRFDPVTKKLDLDFVLHGDSGPASAWAARAAVGDSFEISAVHPRSGFPIQSSTQHYLLFGDETALPAIGSILDTLPAHARAEVFVEVADDREEQVFQSAAEVSLTWLHRSGNGDAGPRSLKDAVRMLALPGENTAIWVAAESSVVKAIRKHALFHWAVDREFLHAAGYWKRGEADHRDEEGFA
ncbi:siderophore-interacting protein [Paraburkholderia sp. USG1]|uniref:siderophore-interacting protein n=1 Tax=Paraburkholderia sp. USG1 TaxID=2952268 RepID=UPI0028602A70|nr:siderophore-interacting protein [Paraburkholderia sp. USG1]MDR8398310.1 siderophore-interacting protein [Paraburkholderia sp. USG1]